MGSARGSGRGGAEEIGGGFGENDFHYGFAVAGGGDGASFRIGVAATTDERRIANAAGKFAASASSGSGGEQAALFIEGDGADSALFVATMMFGGVGVFAAAEPGFALGRRDQIFGIAKRDAVLGGKTLRTFSDEHHVRAFFEDGTREANGIFNALQAGDRARAKSGGVHDDGVAFDAAIEIEMGAETSIEDGIVLENEDGGFDGVERVATAGEDRPAGLQGAEATGFTGVDGVIGNIPGTAVNDERWAHVGEKGYQRKVTSGW